MLKVIYSQLSFTCDDTPLHQYPRPCGRTGQVHTPAGNLTTVVSNAGVTNRTVSDAFINRLGP